MGVNPPSSQVQSDESAPARLSSPGAWPTRTERDDMADSSKRCSTATLADPDQFYWFFRKCHIGGGCWKWDSPKSNGYGYMGVEGKQLLAHRLSYELLVGPIPEGLELDHLCRNRACVNPAHLEAVTHAENSRRSPTIGRGAGKTQRARTHCPRGHPYDEENTYHNPQGHRKCRECNRIWCRARWRVTNG